MRLERDDFIPPGFIEISPFFMETQLAGQRALVTRYLRMLRKLRKRERQNRRAGRQA